MIINDTAIVYSFNFLGNKLFIACDVSNMTSRRLGQDVYYRAESSVSPAYYKFCKEYNMRTST
jgi:hypothetical protein